MLFLPAIDLMDGCVVRLQRGDPQARTVYSNEPVAFARQWQEMGGDWLHLVDLDAAFSGESRNLAHVREICQAVSLPCELGGGMRSVAAVEAALAAGVSRVVLGTKAAESLGFVAELAGEFGSERIAVGIDARDGFVSTHGWQTPTSLLATDFARQVEEAGAGVLIYTDIATDGMLQGPNFAALQEMQAASSLPLIASGGVSSRADLEALEQLPGLYGAIIGKALYDGKITGKLR
jgi:phosphoribosylformimino-5-aminoimidazole carboxamide ribotide isomerase